MQFAKGLDDASMGISHCPLTGEQPSKQSRPTLEREYVFSALVVEQLGRFRL
jgi:hypothetical protein